jgi:hypothetical protein
VRFFVVFLPSHTCRAFASVLRKSPAVFSQQTPFSRTNGEQDLRLRAYHRHRNNNSMRSAGHSGKPQSHLRHFGDRMTALHRLACLRVLVWRGYGIKSPSGLPYPQRERAVRNALGI